MFSMYVCPNRMTLTGQVECGSEYGVLYVSEYSTVANAADASGLDISILYQITYIPFTHIEQYYGWCSKQPCLLVGVKPLHWQFGMTEFPC